MSCVFPLKFRHGSTMTYEDAMKYACGLLLFNGIQSLSWNQYFMVAYHNAMKIRVAVCSLIYRKVSILPANMIIDHTKYKS